MINLFGDVVQTKTVGSLRKTSPPLLKASQYNFFVNSDDNFVLAFNAMSRAMGRFSSQQYETVKKIIRSPNGSVGELSNGISIKSYLLQGGFLIPNNIDEFALLRNRNELTRRGSDRFDLILIPTMDCNFRCTYCYETHRPQRIEKDVEKAIKEWAEHNIPRYHFFSISWFGGEPLLELATLFRMSDCLRRICQRNSCHFTNSITTNGYLLDDSTVDVLANASVQNFNFTVDGPPHFHNQFRPHRNHSETFRNVLEGIIRVARKIPDAKITVRINYDSRNVHSIPELYPLFPEDIRPHISLLFRQIFGNKTQHCLIPEKNRLERVLYEEAERYGYRIQLGHLALGPKETFCYADKENSLIISPGGDIFKCAVSDFTERTRFGILERFGRIAWNEKRRNEWSKIDPFGNSQCQICQYLPLCMGGCRAERMAKGHVENCTQPFEHMEFLLKQLYRRKALSK